MRCITIQPFVPTGAGESVVFEKLLSWTQSPDVGVKYFSGTACYRKEFYMPAEMCEEDRYTSLDLGEIKNIAEVALNGKNLGVLWKPPFSVDISDVVKPGINTLEVKVTNLWPNRLIGDQFLPEGKRFTRTNIRKFTKDSPLMESGLLGPVRIVSAIRKVIEF